MRLGAIAAVLALLLAAPARAEGLAVVGATWIRNDAPVGDCVLVVERDRIKALGTRAEVPIPKGVLIVDGRRRVLAPIAGAPPLAVGQVADFVLLDRDPRQDAAALAHPYKTVKAGRVVAAREP